MSTDDYGLPGFRDNEGNIKPQDHEFEYRGQTVRIQLIPPTVSELESYEDMGNDVAKERLQEIFDRHILKPEIPNVGNLTIDELKAYVQGIIDYAQRGDELGVAARQEIGKRGTSPGN